MTLIDAIATGKRFRRLPMGDKWWSLHKYKQVYCSCKSMFFFQPTLVDYMADDWEVES